MEQCRDVLWEVHNGHSIAQPKQGGAAGPLWQIMDTVEADLADLKSTVTFFHNRNSGNYASEASVAYHLSALSRTFDGAQ